MCCNVWCVVVCGCLLCRCMFLIQCFYVFVLLCWKEGSAGNFVHLWGNLDNRTMPSGLFLEDLSLHHESWAYISNPSNHTPSCNPLTHAQEFRSRDHLMREWKRPFLFSIFQNLFFINSVIRAWELRERGNCGNLWDENKWRAYALLFSRSPV